jgi:lactate dehydrogenase-like 2-hydroxyacid dehydrogenase
MVPKGLQMSAGAASKDSSSRRLFVSFPVLSSVRELFQARFATTFSETGRTLTRAELLLALEGRNTLVTTTTDRLDAETIAQFPRTIRSIATYSVGLDHIDLAAAKERGIEVLNTPDVLTDAVADLALFLILGAARRGTESINLIRGGSWTGWTPTQLPGIELTGKTLGIVGMGRIGRAVARRATAFGMQVSYHNRHRLPRDSENNAIHHATLSSLLRVSEVLLLACPSTPETNGLLDQSAIAQLPQGAIVVNVSRGSVVDDAALIEGLAVGRLRGAGIDVFANEPHVDSRYFDLPNVFMTPHIGSSTVEAREAMANVLLEGLSQLDQGIKPTNQVA